MKKLLNSEWGISVRALAALLGTFIGISLGRQELNLTFAIGYLAVWVLVVGINAIYVFYKSNKNNGM